MSLQIVVEMRNSSPGDIPKSIWSSTWHAIQRASVTHDRDKSHSRECRHFLENATYFVIIAKARSIRSQFVDHM